MLLSLSLHAKTRMPVCSEALSLKQFESQVTEVKDKYFPEFKDLSIIVGTFKSDEYFLQAQPKIKSLFKKRSKRVYEVKLNTKLLACPPTPQGLEAILVHELEHIRDYTVWSSKKIVKHALQYSFNCDLRIGYERMTDLRVLNHGLHDGLIDYRHWVYSKLSQKKLKAKRLIYLTPEEIEDHRLLPFIIMP